MKKSSPSRFCASLPLCIFSIVSASLLGSPSALAVTHANNTTALNLPGAWVGGVTPAGTDIALWDATTLAANVSANLGGNQTWGQIQITNPGAAIVIGNTPIATLTLNGVSGIGINMSGASQNLTINTAVALGGAQSWNVGVGRTLTVGNAVNNGGNLLTIQGAGSETITGAMSGAGGFTKGGSYSFLNLPISGRVLSVTGGTTTLGANNTYTGATTVSVGTVQVNTAGGRLSGTSSLTVNGNSTFINGDTTAANNNGVTNRINSAASLSLGGSNGAGTFTTAFGTGAVDQTLASLSIGQGANVINTSNTAAGTSSLTFTGTGGAGYTRVTGGALNVVNASGFTPSFTNAPTTAGGSSVSGTGIDAILIGATLNGNDFIAAQAGTLAAATYTTAAAGTTSLTSGANINATGTSTIASAATINSLRFASPTAITLTLAGANVISSGGILSGTSGTVDNTPASTLTGGSITSGTGDLNVFAYNVNTDPRTRTGLIIGSQIVDNGVTPVALTITGPSAGSGVVRLTNATNNYSGGTFLNNGQVSVAGSDGATFGYLGANTGAVIAVSGLSTVRADTAVVNFAAARNFSVNSGASLSFVNFSAIVGVSTAITVAGQVSGGGQLGIGYVSDGTRLILTGNNSGFTGQYNLNGILRANEGTGLSSNANLLFNGRMGFADAGVLETNGSFIRALGTGAGQVQWQGTGSLGYGAGGFSAVGGALTVNLNNNASTLKWSTGFFLADGANSSLNLQTSAATNTLEFQNGIDLNGLVGGSPRTIRVGSSGAATAATISGVISDSVGTAGLAKEGTGTLILSNANTYVGATSVNGGVLKAGIASVAGVSGAFGNNSAVTLANTAGVALDITGFNTTVGSLAGGGATGGNVNLGAATLTVGTNNTTTTFSGIISGAGGGLTKAGTGSMTLTRANTYTGTTAISAGTLILSSTGSIANSSAIDLGTVGTFDVSGVTGFSVASGQVLRGSGTVIGATTIASGGTLAIGNSPGTMTFNNDLTLASGSISNFEINGFTFSMYDLAQGGSGTQSVDFNGTLNLLFQSGFNTIGSVQIFAFENYAGNFTSVAASGLASGYSATFDQLTGTVSVAAVPEPATWILVGLGSTLLVVRRRRCG